MSAMTLVINFYNNMYVLVELEHLSTVCSNDVFVVAVVCLDLYILCMHMACSILHNTFIQIYVPSKPESNMLRILPKLFSGISQTLHLLCSSVFPLCLHYAPRLTTFLIIILEHFNQ